MSPKPPLSTCAGKKELVHQLLTAKEASGKSFTEIGGDLGLTNMYTAQLFHNQACTLPAPVPPIGRSLTMNNVMIVLHEAVTAMH